MEWENSKKDGSCRIKEAALNKSAGHEEGPTAKLEQEEIEINGKHRVTFT